MKKSEIFWSLMHPTPLDAEYMKKVVTAAERYRVDGFEICGECHSVYGGLDGLLCYEEYPKAAKSIDAKAVEANREKLREILRIAHASGRPVIYWHREVVVPPGLLEEIPALRDDDGEFDLLGEAFSDLLRYKLRKAFEAVPELDGIVLTLTEADFSVIHNSRADKYPPEKVVAHVTEIFASELEKRGKRFVLRSFGSIAEDYEVILAGGAEAVKSRAFEIETKITPYDFDPFLPVNPFLRRIPGASLGAECDCLGEFLGAGFMPSENVANIVNYVRSGQAAGVERFALRLDRVGNNIFDNYEINLFAYMKAIDDPAATAESIISEWAGTHYPEPCRAAMIRQGIDGFELIKRVNFVAGNVMFHCFPIPYEFKWVKAGGIFALFRENADLHLLEGIWSILSENRTPGRAAIIREKEEGVEIARRTRDLLSPFADLPECAAALRLWRNGLVAARSVLAFVKCVSAYFDDLEARDEKAPRLRAALAGAEAVYAELLPADFDGAGRDATGFRLENRIAAVYPGPLRTLCRKLLAEEFPAELAAHRRLEALPDVIDAIVCGAVTDDFRLGRYMHGSYARLENGVPVQQVANGVFPNGFVEVEFDVPVSGGKLVLFSLPEARTAFRCRVENRRLNGAFGEGGRWECPLSGGRVKVRIEKAGPEFPLLTGIALLRK